MAIVIGSNFGYTVLAAVGITAQWLIAGFKVSAARIKFKVAYPDNGGGRFSDKLSDEDWVKFNNIKRVSDNYNEHIGAVLSMLLLAGLFQPKLAASLGGLYIAGRGIYGWGYTGRGPAGRIYGAPLMAVALFGLIGTAAWNAASLTILA
ncbi:hypothetical protein IWQ56_002271 [Coemansia nantahalensis]|uniref:Uncharacterized protein n=1 Tax=Coemansia helicoidea TaxID=1286919 RepID=A0ACC1L7N8_9FUNG|nr:hypothetical protein IWQ56_002271 [Coemansia nantahalensis]KAJ2802915.1 hypothetical protein H4R21_002233 [Coemansia helicoidea]